MYIEHFEKEIEKSNYQNSLRLAIINLVSRWDEREAEDFIRSIDRLVQFQSDNEGKWAFPKKHEPVTLLNRFWQRTSDACPIEANEAEKQEDEFHDWVCEQYEQLTIKNY